MIKVIIFGIEDLAQLANFYLKTESRFGHDDPTVVAFTVNREFIKEDRVVFEGLPLVPFEELEKYYPPSEYVLFAPIAKNEVREKIHKEGKAKGYQFLSYVSTKCTNFASEIGENCFIQEDNTLQPFTKIGNNCILWAGNHIGHHSVIEDNVFITSHVVISGRCLIKNGSYLGVNSCVRDGVVIGENSIIGMGAVVTKSTFPGVILIGNPAKPK